MQLKRFKPVYWLYNLMHYKSLKHNKEAYEKYNIHKPLFATISSKDFPDKESRAWLDKGDSRILAPAKQGFQHFEPVIQSKIIDWSDNGYLMLEKFFDEDTCDRIYREVASLQERGKLKMNEWNKIMFANRKSSFIHDITNDKKLKSILEFLLDKEVVAF